MIQDLGAKQEQLRMMTRALDDSISKDMLRGAVLILMNKDGTAVALASCDGSNFEVLGAIEYAKSVFMKNFLPNVPMPPAQNGKN